MIMEDMTMKIPDIIIAIIIMIIGIIIDLTLIDIMTMKADIEAIIIDIIL